MSSLKAQDAIMEQREVALFDSMGFFEVDEKIWDNNKKKRI